MAKAGACQLDGGAGGTCLKLQPYMAAKSTFLFLHQKSKAHRKTCVAADNRRLI